MLRSVIDWVVSWFRIDTDIVLRARHATGRITDDHVERRIAPTPPHRYSPDDRTAIMSMADVRDLARFRSQAASAAALRRSEALTMLAPASAPADTGWETYERMSRLRSALDGIGHVGPQFDARGRAVGNQISISLTAHEAEALIVKTGRDLTKTIAALDPAIINGWATSGAKANDVAWATAGAA